MSTSLGSAGRIVSTFSISPSDFLAQSRANPFALVASPYEIEQIAEIIEREIGKGTSIDSIVRDAMRKCAQLGAQLIISVLKIMWSIDQVVACDVESITPEIVDCIAIGLEARQSTGSAFGRKFAYDLISTFVSMIKRKNARERVRKCMREYDDEIRLMDAMRPMVYSRSAYKHKVIAILTRACN
jgi:hypothetical protein